MLIRRRAVSQTPAYAGIVSGGSWTPASATGTLEFWFKSDTGVFSDAGTTPATNTQTVQQWNDQSGNGRNLSQATAGKRPTFTTGVMNSLPGVDFIDTGSTTTNPIMSTGSFTISSAVTQLVMTVFKTDASFQTFPILYDDASGAGTRPLIFTKRNDTNNFCISDGTNLLGPASGNLFATATNYWYYGIFAGASSAMRSNFSSMAEVTGTLTACGISNGIKIGDNTSTANVPNVKLCEIFCISGFTGTDKTNAVSYVQSRYAL